MDRVSLNAFAVLGVGAELQWSNITRSAAPLRVHGMAGYDDGDSIYGDDDLDALPEDTLDQLENNAILFTQAQTQAPLPHHPPTSDYGDDFDDEDLDDAVVIDESRSTPAVNVYNNRHVPGHSSQQFRPPQYGSANSALSSKLRSNPPPKLNQSSSRYPRPPVVTENGSLRIEQASAPPTQSISEVERLRHMVEEVNCSASSFEQY